MTDLSKYDEIIIWGASFPPGNNPRGGGATSHGRAIESLRNLLEAHGYWDKVICIVDSNEAFHGKRRLGISVESPSSVLEHPKALVIVNTVSVKAIQSAMKTMGIKNDYLIIPYYFYDGTLDHRYSNETAKQDVKNHEAQIRDLYNLEDARTKRYLEIILSMRKKGEDDLYLPEYYEGTGENVAYFCDPELAPEGEVTFIDVGAYTGDSFVPVQSFYGGRMRKYIGFEPDENSLKKLKQCIKEQNTQAEIEIFPYALGLEDREIRFLNAGVTSAVSENGEVVLEQKVFDNLPDAEIIGDAMVKMDIEGAELGALQGMQNFIKEHQPYLAICLYHKEQDLFEIADYIKSLNSGYRLYIRGGWHIECWAVPQRHFT